MEVLFSGRIRIRTLLGGRDPVNFNIHILYPGQGRPSNPSPLFTFKNPSFFPHYVPLHVYITAKVKKDPESSFGLKLFSLILLNGLPS